MSSEKNQTCFLQLPYIGLLISLLASENQSYRETLPVCFLFLRRLRRIFAETIQGSENNSSYKEYIQALFGHFLFTNI